MKIDNPHSQTLRFKSDHLMGISERAPLFSDFVSYHLNHHRLISYCWCSRKLSKATKIYFLLFRANFNRIKFTKMFYKIVLPLIFFALFLDATEAYKILIYSQTLTRSHVILNARVGEALAEDGHDVVGLMFNQTKNNLKNSPYIFLFFHK